MSLIHDFCAVGDRVQLQLIRGSDGGKRSVTPLMAVDLEAAVGLRDALDAAIAIAARERAADDRRAIEISQDRIQKARARIELSETIAARFATGAAG
jgi:hypothetical protein